MKIRKNLSDEDMLKGYEEEVSFENAVYGDEPVKNKKIKTAKKKMVCSKKKRQNSPLGFKSTKHKNMITHHNIHKKKYLTK